MSNETKAPAGSIKNISAKQIGNTVLNNALIIIMLLVAAYVAVTKPSFLSPSSLVNLLSLTAAYLPVALGIAGCIVLTGTEIKSIRLGKASLVDTFCYFTKGELWVKNMHIAEYFYGSYNNHTARRERKLLLNKKELEKLQREIKNPGFTIVPVRLFINEKGLAKLVVALAKGKKEYDKRESIKEKDDRRDMARMFKR